MTAIECCDGVCFRAGWGIPAQPMRSFLVDLQARVNHSALPSMFLCEGDDLIVEGALFVELGAGLDDFYEDGAGSDRVACLTGLLFEDGAFEGVGKGNSASRRAVKDWSGL